MNAKMALCKLTGDEGKFVRAHIIPKAFYDLSDDLPLMALTNRPNTRAKRIPIGIYDEQLVVEASERKFAAWDDYAIKLLKPQPAEDAYVREGGQVVRGESGLPLAYLLRDVDYARLKLFFMSVLWRAGATSRPEFNGLDLGPYLLALKTALCRDDPLSPEHFSVVIERYVDGQDVPVTPFFPHRIDGVNFYQTLFGGFRFWIKCDRRPTPTPFNSMQLSEAGPVPVILERFRDSKIRDVLASAAKRYHLANGDPWRGKKSFSSS